MAEKKEENVFEHFSKMNVSDHVEKKMGLSYLSWVWAWTIIKAYDFDATREYTKFDELVNGELTGRKVDYCKTDTGTYVECKLTIKGHTETETLFVMDYKNKTVINPDQSQINKAKQRCFVKAAALFGLGLNLYAGEDLPVASDEPAKPNKQQHAQQTNHAQASKQATKQAPKSQATITTRYFEGAIKKLGQEKATEVFNYAKNSAGVKDTSTLSESELKTFNDFFADQIKQALQETGGNK